MWKTTGAAQVTYFNYLYKAIPTLNDLPGKWEQYYSFKN